MHKKTVARPASKPRSYPARTLKQKPAPRVRQKQTSRRWHIRLSLHPLHLLFELCVGVLLVAATVSSYGDTYTVSGVVPAPLLSNAASITSPGNGTKFTSSATTVSGSCPENSYVELLLNGQEAGYSPCTNSGFSMAVVLTTGANQLLAQDYNLLNLAGPAFPPITVNYTPPATGVVSSSTPSSPSVTPVALNVLRDDLSTSYNSGIVTITSAQPSFSGTAPPYSQITLLLHSNPLECHTTANAVGYWQCTAPEALPVGQHTVRISATTPSGQLLTIPLFYIRVTQAQPNGTTVPLPIPPNLSTSYHYQVYQLNQSIPVKFALGGGSGPYTWTVNWGDGQQTTTTKLTSGVISLAHRYTKLNASSGTFTIVTQVIDADGQMAMTQFFVVVHNSAFHAVATTKPNTWQHLLTDLHPWLWILWPGYAIIILMLISFWLGERKQYFLDKQRLRRNSKTRKPRRA